jgi:hypothetical protein
MVGQEGSGDGRGVSPQDSLLYDDRDAVRDGVQIPLAIGLRQSRDAQMISTGRGQTVYFLVPWMPAAPNSCLNACGTHCSFYLPGMMSMMQPSTQFRGMRSRFSFQLFGPTAI